MPARTARLPLFDRVLARVGSSDDPRAGESTFLREMRETAAIVSRATPRSLVVVDEIGRGTSTTDGTAIAYAVCKTLARHDGPLSIFTTHFFELTSLELETDGAVSNAHVDAHVADGVLALLYEVTPGPSHMSYGVHCAKLANFPTSVVEDAATRAAAMEARAALAASRADAAGA